MTSNLDRLYLGKAKFPFRLQVVSSFIENQEQVAKYNHAGPRATRVLYLLCYFWDISIAGVPGEKP